MVGIFRLQIDPSGCDGFLLIPHISAPSSPSSPSIRQGDDLTLESQVFEPAKVTPGLAAWALGLVAWVHPHKVTPKIHSYSIYNIYIYNYIYIYIYISIQSIIFLSPHSAPIPKKLARLGVTETPWKSKAKAAKAAKKQMKPGLKSTGQYLLFLHLICFWLWCHIHCHGAGPRQKWPKSSRKWPKRLQEGSRLQCRSLEFEASSYFKYVNEFVLEVANTYNFRHVVMRWRQKPTWPSTWWFRKKVPQWFSQLEGKINGKSAKRRGGRHQTKIKPLCPRGGRHQTKIKPLCPRSWSPVSTRHVERMPFCDLLWQMSMCEFRTKGLRPLRKLVDADSPEVQQMGCRRATSVAMWKRPAWASRVEQWSSVAGMENRNVL